MKKILTITALLLTGLAIGVNAQRTIDLRTVLLQPIDGTIVNCTDSFPAAWLVINDGPDPIYPTDTVGIADYENLFEQEGDNVNKNFSRCLWKTPLIWATRSLFQAYPGILTIQGSKH